MGKNWRKEGKRQNDVGKATAFDESEKQWQRQKTKKAIKLKAGFTTMTKVF